MFKKLFSLFLMLLLVLLPDQNCFASGAFKTTKVGLTTQSYTGPERVSFSEGAPASGLELGIDAGAVYWRYFVKMRLNSSKGGQYFSKSGTTYFSSYNYSALETEVGGSIFPIARDDMGLNLYVWGAVSGSYNYLVLDDIPSNLNISKKKPVFGFGYGGGIGMEYILFTNRDNKKTLMYAEVGMRDTRAPMAGLNSFQVSGITLTLGIGF